MIENLKLSFSPSFIIKCFYYIFFFVFVSIFSYSFCLSFFRQPLSAEIDYCIFFNTDTICGFLFYIFFHFKYYIYFFLLLVLFSLVFFENNHFYFFFISFLFIVFSFLLYYFEFLFYDVDLFVLNLYLNYFDFFSDWRSDHFLFNFFSEIQIKYSSFEIYSALLSYHFNLYICEYSWFFIFKSTYPIVANAKVLQEFKTIALNSSTIKEALSSSIEFISKVDNIVDLERFREDQKNVWAEYISDIFESFANFHTFYILFTFTAIFNRPFLTRLFRLDQLFFRPGIDPIVPYPHERLNFFSLIEDYKKIFKGWQEIIDLIAYLTGFSGVGYTLFKFTIFDFAEFIDIVFFGKEQELVDVKKIVHENKKDIGKVFISPELIEAMQKKRSLFKE